MGAPGWHVRRDELELLRERRTGGYRAGGVCAQFFERAPGGRWGHACGSSYYFSGGMDEVAVYSNALSPAQVLAHYVAARGTNPAPVAPTSQVNPHSQLLAAGHTAGLLAEASGSLPLSYQWQFQGTNIAGATSSTLTLVNAQATNSGSYQAVVTNLAGSVTSSVAVVTVVAPLGAYSSECWPTSRSATGG